ncbi:hypothetical protein ACQP3L_35985, partial [Escherichia coli]
MELKTNGTRQKNVKCKRKVNIKILENHILSKTTGCSNHQEQVPDLGLQLNSESDNFQLKKGFIMTLT